MKSDNINPALADLFKQLDSEDRNLAHKALNKLLRQSGINEMPQLIQVLSSSKDQKVGKEIEFWLANIKSKKAPSVFARALVEPEFVGIRTQLVRACWETQLDFSPHILLFVHLLMAGEYGLALEAFSVIENTCLEYPIPADQVVDIIKQLNSILPDQPEAKQRLIREMVQVLEPYASVD
ncbi:MAG: hypothetical protein V2A67_03525 [Bacteroidota bacterium]